MGGGGRLINFMVIRSGQNSSGGTPFLRVGPSTKVVTSFEIRTLLCQLTAQNAQ